MNQIERLWELLPHIEGTTVRWFAKSLDGKLRIGGYADTVTELKNAVKNAQGLNFYVCPNPASIRTGVRHSTKDVSHWSWFLIDIDPVVKGDNFDPTVLWSQVFARFSFFMLCPTFPLVIDSGRGIQAWYRLNDRVLTTCNGSLHPEHLDALHRKIITDDDAFDRRTARMAMRYWLSRLDEEFGEVAGCRVDTTCSDLPRPMRCVGTVNVKTGNLAQFISDPYVVHYELAERLVTTTPISMFDDKPIIANNLEWQDVFVHLTKKAQDYISFGRLEPGRHEHLWHTARSCAEQGLTREATRRALVWGNLRRGEEKALDEAAIEHALNTAYKDLLDSE